VNATFNRIRAMYYWPRLKRDVRNHVNRCNACLRSKPSTQLVPGLMGSRKEISQPFEVISCDILGPLIRSEKGYKYLLVSVDYFSKFVFLRPIRADNADCVCDHLQGNVVRCKSQIYTGPTDTCSIPLMMICDHSNSGAKRLLPPVATLKVGG